jgi:hypothetical protein
MRICAAVFAGNAGIARPLRAPPPIRNRANLVQSRRGTRLQQPVRHRWLRGMLEITSPPQCGHSGEARRRVGLGGLRRLTGTANSKKATTKLGTSRGSVGELKKCRYVVVMSTRPAIGGPRVPINSVVRTCQGGDFIANSLIQRLDPCRRRPGRAAALLRSCIPEPQLRRCAPQLVLEHESAPSRNTSPGVSFRAWPLGTIGSPVDRLSKQG